MNEFMKKYPFITCLLIDIAFIVVQLAVNDYKRIIQKRGNK